VDAAFCKGVKLVAQGKLWLRVAVPSGTERDFLLDASWSVLECLDHVARIMDVVNDQLSLRLVVENLAVPVLLWDRPMLDQALACAARAGAPVTFPLKVHLMHVAHVVFLEKETPTTPETTVLALLANAIGPAPLPGEQLARTLGLLRRGERTGTADGPLLRVQHPLEMLSRCGLDATAVGHPVLSRHVVIDELPCLIAMSWEKPVKSLAVIRDRGSKLFASAFESDGQRFELGRIDSISITFAQIGVRPGAAIHALFSRAFGDSILEQHAGGQSTTSSSGTLLKLSPSASLSFTSVPTPLLQGGTVADAHSGFMFPRGNAPKFLVGSSAGPSDDYDAKPALAKNVSLVELRSCVATPLMVAAVPPLNCSICLDELLNPKQCRKCGEAFCGSCSSKIATCAICRTRGSIVDNPLLSSVAAASDVSELKRLLQCMRCRLLIADNVFYCFEPKCSQPLCCEACARVDCGHEKSVANRALTAYLLELERTSALQSACNSLPVDNYANKGFINETQGFRGRSGDIFSVSLGSSSHAVFPLDKAPQLVVHEPPEFWCPRTRCLAFKSPDSGTWTRDERVSFNVQGNTAVASVPHFSDFAFASLNLSDPIIMSPEFLNPGWDFDFADEDDSAVEHWRGNERYYRPIPAFRFAINVAAKYPGAQDWLGTGANDPQVWPVAFHGTNSKNIDSILKNGLFAGGTNGIAISNGAAFGHGIYCTPDPEKARDEYSNDVEDEDGNSYRVIFQLRVNAQRRASTRPPMTFGRFRPLRMSALMASASTRRQQAGSNEPQKSFFCGR
jgi:hypothetical protein